MTLYVIRQVYSPSARTLWEMSGCVVDAARGVGIFWTPEKRQCVKAATTLITNGGPMGRKKHTKEFKSTVAVAAIKGHQTVNEIVSEFGIHPASYGA